MNEEEELVLLLQKYESNGFAATRPEITHWVMKALLMRRETRGISGKWAEQLAPLSVHAIKFLDNIKDGSAPHLSRRWYDGFYYRHPCLKETNAIAHMSPQRAMASTIEIRDALFTHRTKLATALGLLHFTFMLIHGFFCRSVLTVGQAS